MSSPRHARLSYSEGDYIIPSFNGLLEWWRKGQAGILALRHRIPGRVRLAFPIDARRPSQGRWSLEET